MKFVVVDGSTYVSFITIYQNGMNFTKEIGIVSLMEHVLVSRRWKSPFTYSDVLQFVPLSTNSMAYPVMFS